MRAERFAIVLACFVACGCGGDSDGAAQTFDHDGGKELPDAGTGLGAEDADFKGCPAGIPTAAPGLRATGEQFAMRVIAAMPAEPERYANRWTSRSPLATALHLRSTHESSAGKRSCRFTDTTAASFRVRGP